MIFVGYLCVRGVCWFVRCVLEPVFKAMYRLNTFLYIEVHVYFKEILNTRNRKSGVP